MKKRVVLWAAAGWAVFGLLGAVALLPSEAAPHQLATGFLVPGIFGLMVGGMLGLVRQFRANQRELGRFLLTVIAGTVLLGTMVLPFSGLPGWVAPLAAALGAWAGLWFSLRQLRQPLSPGEGLLMLAATLVLGYQSYGAWALPIVAISALAIHHHLGKQPRC